MHPETQEILFACNAFHEHVVFAAFVRPDESCWIGVEALAILAEEGIDGVIRDVPTDCISIDHSHAFGGSIVVVYMGALPAVIGAFEGLRGLHGWIAKNMAPTLARVVGGIRARRMERDVLGLAMLYATSGVNPNGNPAGVGTAPAV